MSTTVSFFGQKGIYCFEYVAEHDDRTCLICQWLDGKIINIDDFYYFPPLHWWCRCILLESTCDASEFEESPLYASVELSEKDILSKIKEFKDKYIISPDIFKEDFEKRTILLGLDKHGTQT